MEKRSNIAVESAELDELDLRLLEALQRNARSTFAELGALVGLKPPAVHDRVKRLETRWPTNSSSACPKATTP